MSQKKYKVTISSSAAGYTKVAQEKVVAFNQRLNESMKEIDRDFQKKQKTSADRASQIVLNA